MGISVYHSEVQEEVRLTSQMALYMCLSAFWPHWLSKLNSLSEGPAVPALLSPCRQNTGACHNLLQPQLAC